jgi:hypothetical protein
MTKPDRQKLSVLVVLLAVLGLTLLMGYRMYEPPTAASVQPPEQAKASANPPADSDARIRLDLVEKDSGSGDIGKKNVFQYGQTPPSVLPGSKPSALVAAPAPPVVVPTTIPPRPTGPPPPPPPPPIPLKYQGYASMKSTGGLTAFLVDDTRPNDVKHFNVAKNEVLMGRYRLTNISETSVEIEDLEYNRRQTLPLLK